MYSSSEQEEFLNGPGLPPPDGVTPNFTEPPVLQITGYVVLCVCLFISMLVVCMRLYTKARIIRVVSPEDCTSTPRFPTLYWDKG